MSTLGFHIEGRFIAPDEPAYVIAEVSANHLGDRARALRLVEAAAAAGADAVKFQTYTADTMTLDLAVPPFVVGPGTVWEGRTLYGLYEEAFTPWEWHAELADAARQAGLQWFSTPFDASAVDFLEGLGASVYKIASFENVDVPLIRKAASTGKPLIISTGMASKDEIEVAVHTAREAGASGVALLRCNSSYPAPLEEMDLRTIPDMAQHFGVPVGLSDHTLGDTAAVASVALGAVVFEKHITLDRSEGGPDASFSAEPPEFAAYVDAIRRAQAALGSVRYGPSETERPSLAFRRSLWVVKDVVAGEPFTDENVRALRPGDGLGPGELDRILGRVATRDVARGTPVSWDLVEG